MDFNQILDTLIEGKEILNLEAGNTIETFDGNELTVKEIWVTEFHKSSPTTMVLYKYKTKDGKKGIESNSLSTFKKIING